MGDPPLASSRGLFLAAGALAMLLGLCIVGAALVDTARLRDEATAGLRPRATIVLPGVASPLVVEERVRTYANCLERAPSTSWPDETVPAPPGADPRDYLSKMAELRFQRRSATTTALDPYQAALNPSVYLVNAAALPMNSDDPARASRGQICESP